MPEKIQFLDLNLLKSHKQELSFDYDILAKVMCVRGFETYLDLTFRLYSYDDFLEFKKSYAEILRIKKRIPENETEKLIACLDKLADGTKKFMQDFRMFGDL